MKFFYKSWVIGLPEFQHQKFLILIFIMTSCIPEEETVIPLPSNECCIDRKCISLREGYFTIFADLSNSAITVFEVDITSGGKGALTDRIVLRFNSPNPTEIIPGKYEWKDFNLHEPNSITYGLMKNVTITSLNLFGYSYSATYDYYYASQGSVTIKKDGNSTIFIISLIADNKSLTGYFNGILQPK